MLLLVVLFVFQFTVGCQKVVFKKTVASGPFEPAWDSLRNHYQSPEWFNDAKFGIYTHWGPVTVGSETTNVWGCQWYGRSMYRKKDRTKLFEAHRRAFGDHNQFGYKDVIPLFNPQKFDADQWA